jgi:Apea-like HEPN
VQTAISFEALYGGAKGEPVVETLANRVAYSLGTSPQSREQLVETFCEFYDTRSAIVHNGATRLSNEQQRELVTAQSSLKKALRHELRLVSEGVAEIAGVRRR